MNSKIEILKYASREKLSDTSKRKITGYGRFLEVVKQYDGLVLVFEVESKNMLEPRVTAFCGQIKVLLDADYAVRFLLEREEGINDQEHFCMAVARPDFRAGVLVGAEVACVEEPIKRPGYISDLKKIKLEEFDNFFSDYLNKHFVIL